MIGGTLVRAASVLTMLDCMKDGSESSLAEVSPRPISTPDCCKWSTIAFIAFVSLEMAGADAEDAVERGVAPILTEPVVVIDGELLIMTDGAGTGVEAGVER